MGTFGEAERKILGFMVPGTNIFFNNKKYTILKSDKPTCRNGEPKTDIYVLAESDTDVAEIKISYKKENADFVENKISAQRAEQLFGDEWEKAVRDSTEMIRYNFFNRMLIYKKAFQHTEAGSITLGWKFEFVNKVNGDLSGEVIMDKAQLRNLILDVYAGINLSEDKKDAMVCGQTVKNSGIANYLLMNDSVSSAQEVIDKMVSIEDFIDSNPKIYFACKALNLRSFTGKLKGSFDGKFTGKLTGSVRGEYWERIDKKKKIYSTVPVYLDGDGSFDGIIDGHISGIAEGKFEGDMSSFKLGSKVTKQSSDGTFKPKWDQDRPLAVQVEWSEEDGRLTPKLIFDRPLRVKGNKMAERLIDYMRKMDITSVKDIDASNAGTDRIVSDKE
jgi:hypothetical protein